MRFCFRSWTTRNRYAPTLTNRKVRILKKRGKVTIPFSEILKIRELYNSGVSTVSLAKLFRHAYSYIERIVRLDMRIDR